MFMHAPSILIRVVILALVRMNYPLFLLPSWQGFGFMVTGFYMSYPQSLKKQFPIKLEVGHEPTVLQQDPRQWIMYEFEYLGEAISV